MADDGEGSASDAPRTPQGGEGSASDEPRIPQGGEGSASDGPRTPQGGEGSASDEPHALLEGKRHRYGRFRRSGWAGCLLWVVAFVLVIVGGCVVGIVLRPDPDARFTAVRTAEYTLRGYHDEDDEPCLELVREGEVQAGQCGFGQGGAYTVTTLELRDGRVIAFAPVPEGAVAVRVPTSEGVKTVEVDERKDVRWFVYVGGPLTDEPVRPVDAAGEVVPVPAGG